MKPIMTATRLLLALLAPTALLAACGEAAPQAQPTEPLPVHAVQVGQAQDGETIAATGTVHARRETVLAFTTPGRIAALTVDEGDRVRGGQLLASLDPARVGAAASSARAEARRRGADLGRLQSLYRQGWVTRTQLDAAEAAAQSAQAQVRATAFDVDAARVEAPGAGLVLRRHAEPGQIVMAGEPVVTLAEADEGFVLRVPLADRDLRRLSVGQPAAVRIGALGTPPLAGRIIEIGGRSDSATGTFEAEIALPMIEGLRSGLIGDAEIVAAGPATGTTIAVPPLAVFAARAGEGFVYVVRSGRARARLVRLGTVDDRRVEVVAGLRPGERVIVTGIDRLRNGMPVRVSGP